MKIFLLISSFIIGFILLGNYMLNLNFENDLYNQINKAFINANIPGMSVIVINNNKISKDFNFGYSNIETHKKITSDTLFQAGSISKSIAAVDLLVLATQYNINLNTNVNKYLKSWHLSYSKYPNSFVTLNQLLSMTSGVNVSSFRGYDREIPLPKLLDILNGTSPANSGMVNLDNIPGKQYTYSGGGYTIIEQVLEDVAHANFIYLTQKLIFTPLQMEHSTYNATQNYDYSFAYTKNNTRVAGGWNVYPEYAAAGLWTNAGDLAKFSVAVMEAYQNRSSILKFGQIKEIFKIQPNSYYGQGFYIDESKSNTLIVSKGGATYGFRSMIVLFPNSGNGIVIMTNSENGTKLIKEIISIITSYYSWPNVKFTDPMG